MARNTEDLFDPADQETEELVVPEFTDESAHTPDTMGDPEGSEARAEQPAIVLPDYYFKRYDLDDDGNPIFKPAVVTEIMKVFDEKKGSSMVFHGDNEVVIQEATEALYDKEGVEVVAAIEETKVTQAEYFYRAFDDVVKRVAAGVVELLGVDPQTTGINFLQLTTRTWAEFVSNAYEYQDSASTLNPNVDIPDWFTAREDKMQQLGRKARICSEVIALIDEDFGLARTSLERVRVQNEVERRLQRLAEWTYGRQADTSVKVAKEYNQASVDHLKEVFASA